MPSGNSVANTIQASPMFSDQKLILAARSLQSFSGIMYRKQKRAKPTASIPYTPIIAACAWFAVRAVPIS